MTTIDYFGAVSVGDFFSENAALNLFSSKEIKLREYNWQKRNMPYSKYLFYKYNEFPYKYGYDVLVLWNKSTDEDKMFEIWVDIVTERRTLVVHPFTFCRMLGSKYGTDKALDALKMVMNDRINMIFSNGAYERLLQG